VPEQLATLRPVIFSQLQPLLSITVVRDSAGIAKLADYFRRKREKKDFTVCYDTETNICDDFYYRRVRTMQFGDRDEQYVVDLLAIAVSSERLNATQGNYGANHEGVYDELLNVIRPVLCTNEFLKVGQNLAFEYEVSNWNFGLRIWNLYSTDMAERVIRAGSIPLKKMAEFSMASIAARYFKLLIDKSNQKSFDLESPLTQDQIEYAAFDVRFPLALRQGQLNLMNADQLVTVAQIENDAIGTFTDMHLIGQNLDDERWKKRIDSVVARRAGELRTLDEHFIPIVGRKDSQIDEAEIERRLKHWKEDFEIPTVIEQKLAESKRKEKDKAKKDELGKQLDEAKKVRAKLKAEARSQYTELSKKRTEWKNMLEKCEGEAYINYGSREQLLEALKKMPGLSTLKNTQDDTLLQFNDKPLIQVLRKYNKGRKDTGTYGLQWTQRWITKPLSKEGWRHPVDGRLHCRFNQLEAETGRTSSSQPNAQNLPKDDEVRACFICDPPNPKIRISVCCDSETEITKLGHYKCKRCEAACDTKDEEYCIVTCDMAGAELRIIAELAKAQTWIKAFAMGWDVHSVSTEILEPIKWPSLACKGGEKHFDKEKNKEVTLPPCEYYAKDEKGELKRLKCKCPGHAELRQKTKSINFLLCYGGGPDALADELGITVEAAKKLMQQHERAFPDVWGYLKDSGERAKQFREARDMYGRRRSFPVPTREEAKEWFESENSDKLELSEADTAANLLSFKTQNLREPNKEEMYGISHREANYKEVDYAIYALNGSVARRGKNHCIQGTNASIIKRAMGCGYDKFGKPYLWHTLPQYNAFIINMVHDELVLQCPKRYGKQVAELLADAFKRAAAEVMHLVVMEADYHISNRWMK
jgi:DNA polymerase I-like protein with 3'-5' exonuclease and polymerase domains